MRFLQILKILIGLLPIVVEAVKTVEQALPVSGQGQQKLAMVRQMIESAYQAAGDVEVAFEQIWPAVSAAISAAVAMFNAAGVFKK